MKKARSITLTLAMVWVLLKLIFFFLDRADIGFHVGVFGNLLFILVGISATLWFKYKQTTLQDSTFLDDLKDTMKSAGTYVIIVVAFLFVYHKIIDPELLESKIRESAIAYAEYLEDPANLEEARGLRPDMAEMSKEEILKLQGDSQRQILSPGVTTALSLFALIAVSVFYAIVTTLLFRKVLLK